MESVDSKAIACCKRILDLLEKEKNEIAEKKLEGVERYCALKMDLLKELDEINKEEATASKPKRQAELEPLLKKIIALNDKNAEAVRNMKDEIINEVSISHKQKSALKAYNP